MSKNYSGVILSASIWSTQGIYKQLLDSFEISVLIYQKKGGGGDYEYFIC